MLSKRQEQRRWLALPLLLRDLETPVNVFSASALCVELMVTQREYLRDQMVCSLPHWPHCGSPQALWDTGCHFKNHCWRIKRRCLKWEILPKALETKKSKDLIQSNHVPPIFMSSKKQQRNAALNYRFYFVLVYTITVYHLITFCVFYSLYFLCTAVGRSLGWFGFCLISPPVLPWENLYLCSKRSRGGRSPLSFFSLTASLRR